MPVECLEHRNCKLDGPKMNDFGCKYPGFHEVFGLETMGIPLPFFTCVQKFWQV